MPDHPEPLRESPPDYGLDLPVAPPWFSDAPKGSIEDGIRLSIEALKAVQNRPEIFGHRDACRCDVEFKL